MNQEDLDQFIHLSYEEKKSELLSILSYIKNKASVFMEMFLLLQSIENPTEELLMIIYKDILLAINSTQEVQKINAIKKLQASHNSLQNIHKEELEYGEKKDADALLDNYLNESEKKSSGGILWKLIGFLVKLIVNLVFIAGVIAFCYYLYLLYLRYINIYG